MVFEYIDGQPLEAAIPPDGLAPDKVIGYARQIASALAAVADLGLVHRDLKPSNIMLTRSGVVKILDFGLAGLHGPEMPAQTCAEPAGDDDPTLVQNNAAQPWNPIAGTPGYMAPEQLAGGPVDIRADIYALGAVIFKMATGLEFAATAQSEGREQALQRLHKPLWRLARRCLEPDPALRYQQPGELLEAMPDTRPARLSHIARRVTALGLGVLLAGVGIAFWYLTRFSPGRAVVPDRPEPLTSYGGRQVGTSFSPDGGSFAFAWDGGEQEVLDIYTQRVGGTQYRRLTRGAKRSYNPVWSPDGKWIAFVRASINTQAALIAVPAEGGDERTIALLEAAPYLDGTALDWSRDGRWIVYGDVIPSSKKGIWAASFASGQKRLIVSPGSQDGYYTQPAISPDGRSIVFVEDFYGVTRLKVGRLDGQMNLQGEPAALRLRGLDSFDPSGPRWLGGPDRLVFTANGSGFQRALWYVDVSGGMRQDLVPRQIESISGFVSHPEVSRDGSMIALTEQIEDRNIWRMPLRGGATEAAPAVKLFGSTRQERNAQYSVDGKKIAFDSDQNGLPQVWVSDADGSNSYPLTNFRSAFNPSPRWSPDGRQVVFDDSDGGRPAIYTIEARRGAKPVRVTPAGGSYVEPGFCEGGKAVYYVNNTTSILEIWRSPVAGGSGRRVLGKDAYQPVCSPDGRSLYYLGDEGLSTFSLMRMSLADGAKELLTRHVDPGLFALASRVYFLRNRQNPRSSDVFSVDVTGSGSARGDSERWEGRMEGKVTGLSISPDGKFALVSRMDHDTSTLVVLRRPR